jgi:hypothetical protein
MIGVKNNIKWELMKLEQISCLQIRKGEVKKEAGDLGFYPA